MNFFDTSLTLALTICVIGTIWRVAQWYEKWSDNTLPSVANYPTISLYRQSIRTISTFILEVVFLVRTGRANRLRWLAHCLVFYGFMGLLLFHAMDDTITTALFPTYEPTLDPWQFLRNLFGAMALTGLALMTYRRIKSQKLRTLTRFQDWATILIIACIIMSGFLLEASKIISPTVFERMTDEYFIPDDGTDVTALKTYWAQKYGVVFSQRLPTTKHILEKGASLDEDNCVDCHSDTSSAFISRPLATMFGPLAPALNRSQADKVFWYFHIIFCFIALAALPFGKFFHPISTTANILARQGRRADTKKRPPDLLRNIGMNACTRCGECSLHCSVAPSFTVLGNQDILPSEKLLALRQFHTEKSLSSHRLKAFAEGTRICTECLRCTDICPSGINLQDLWIASKVQAAKQSPAPDQIIRQKSASEWALFFEKAQADSPVLSQNKGLADNAASFQNCVQCTTCTSVCPVVAVCEDPTMDLDLLPQQIMNLLRMGLKNQTLGARMVWSCTTCYKCQEHCPQDIRVADILYELRNTVATRLKTTDKTCINGEKI